MVRLVLLSIFSNVRESVRVSVGGRGDRRRYDRRHWRNNRVAHSDYGVAGVAKCYGPQDP